MDGFGVNLVQKAQNSALRRWFNKQKSTPAQIDGVKHEPIEASRPVADHEAAKSSSHEGSEIEVVDGCAAQHRPGHRDQEPTPAGDMHEQFTPDDMLPLSVSDLDQPYFQPNGTLCERLGIGQDILTADVDAAEYTDFAGGIFNGFDSIKKCPVLLLTYESTLSIPKLLRFQREVLKQERQAHAKLESLSDYEIALANEIRNHKSLLAQYTEDDKSTAGTAEEPDRTENLQQELDNLERLLKGAENRRGTIEANLRRRRNLLQVYQTDVNQFLEVAFLGAQAIEAESDEDEEVAEVPEISVKEEYQKLLAQMQEINGTQVTEAPVTLTPHTTTDIFADTQTNKRSPEQQARTEASKALWEAREDLQYARVQFEQRNETRQRELNDTIALELRGEPVPFNSVEEFDLHWIQRFREITQELQAAEEGLSRAQAAAKTAGPALEYENQSSCFPDDPADGNAELMSNENDSPEVFAGDPRMIAWMDSLAHSGDPDFCEPNEVDKWGSGEEVDWCDSASAVACGSERKRIDAWKRSNSIL
ncbi:uncharacterized protein RCC_04470 [Ramularia collo-cygni]|uniref:Uncharacterized protein n=1 Tax=Ramularia collo-cygni TaxID=112498 RepID=A0A2D3V511_9PEZI|nr:uncharacterized protein RCC_04470 [Ramularia collo-cygni]CZT18626.1 uncharacterized protein RCC_04470 [Ramularia collo-cygni]